MDSVPEPSPTPVFSGKPLYALIDPWIREPSVVDIPPSSPKTFDELERLRSAAWDRPVTLCRDDKPLIDAKLAPYLVALDGGNDPWCESLTKLAAEQADHALADPGTPFTMGGFLECDLSPDRLMSRLQTMWCQFLGGRKRYIRIADPRVVELLAHLLPPQEMRSWLGPLHALSMRRRDGSWMRLVGTANDDQIDDEASFYRRTLLLQEAEVNSTTLVLDGTRRRRVLQGEAVSRTLDELQRQRVLRADSIESAFQAVEKAATLGLTHVDDVATFAWKHIRQSPDLSGAGYAEALASARRQPGTFEIKLGETA